MALPEVTVLLPTYNTAELTKLCLRLIRKHTDLNLAKVIVIDNGSTDHSRSYLRTLKWIKLIERQPDPSESGALSHSRALDLALERIDTPFVLSIHTDTLVRNKDWLPFLLSEIKMNAHIAGVGSWKLEKKTIYEKILKYIEFFFQRSYYFLIGKKHVGLESSNHHIRYLRSHCALYRLDLIKKHNTCFSDGEEMAGKRMHRKLIAHGYQMKFIPTNILLKYMEHINHATTALNPELSRRKSSVKKGLRRIKKNLAQFNASAILQEHHLDY